MKVVGFIFLISLAIFGVALAFHVRSQPTSTPEPTPKPPNYTNVAQMARYVIHYSDWASVSYIAQAENTPGYPRARVYDMSDGPLVYGGSTGVPYFYTSLLNPGTSALLNVDPRSSVTASLTQGSYCKANSLDPQDPRCARVTLTGNFTRVKKNSKEWDVAQTSLFTRYPHMKDLPKNHHFFFAKLDIKDVEVIDYFGGSKHPSVADYFRSDPPYESLEGQASVFDYQAFSVV